MHSALEPARHLAWCRAVIACREQLQSLGFSYDWQREVSTCDPKYFKWTQWIFLQLFKEGLAYQAEVPVNWCPALGTGVRQSAPRALANARHQLASPKCCLAAVLTHERKRSCLRSPGQRKLLVVLCPACHAVMLPA